MLNYLLKRLSYTRFWTWIIKNFFSKFTFRWNGYPEFPMEKYFELEKAIAESDTRNGSGLYAFVSCDTKSLAAKLIRWSTKSYWTHAGVLYFTPDKKIRILHFRATGACDWHILEMMKQVDCFAVGRIELVPGGLERVNEKIRAILSDMAKYSYDFQAELDNGNRFYCSELVYWLAKDYAVDKKFLPHVEFGRLAFEPDDLYVAMRKIFNEKND